jgi:hypothetical protein
MKQNKQNNQLPEPSHYSHACSFHFLKNQKQIYAQVYFIFRIL